MDLSKGLGKKNICMKNAKQMNTYLQLNKSKFKLVRQTSSSQQINRQCICIPARGKQSAGGSNRGVFQIQLRGHTLWLTESYWISPSFSFPIHERLNTHIFARKVGWRLNGNCVLEPWSIASDVGSAQLIVAFVCHRNDTFPSYSNTHEMPFIPTILTKFY